MSKIKYHARIWKKTILLFMENEALLSAGNMAFLAMLSLFPFVIFLVALSGFLGQTERGIEAINFMFNILPPEVTQVLQAPIRGIIKNTGAEILTGSIIFAVWTAAAGVEAARSVLIKAFGREFARAMWVRRLESLGVVVIGAGAVLAAMSVLVLGPALLKAFTSLFPDVLNHHIMAAWGFLNLLISPLILSLGLYVMYMTLTPRRVRKPYRLPGTIMSVGIFIATAKGLSIYLKYAGNYDVTYGSLAGVVILQMFCFVVAMGFVLGAELNAAYTAARDERMGIKNNETADKISTENESDA